LARATELRGAVAVFQNNLGIALERTGHFEASAGAFRGALALKDGYTKASISLARVEALEEDPVTGPVDLEILALRFVTEMEGWYPPMAQVPPVEEGRSETEEPEVTEIELPEFPVLEEVAERAADSAEVESKVAVEKDTAAVKTDSTKVESDSSGIAKIKPIKPAEDEEEDRAGRRSFRLYSHEPLIPSPSPASSPYPFSISISIL
jgi:hypothetical protein